MLLMYTFDECVITCCAKTLKYQTLRDNEILKIKSIADDSHVLTRTNFKEKKTKTKKQESKATTRTSSQIICLICSTYM